MPARIVSRLIAVIVIAVILTLGVNQYHNREGRVGKDAFIAAESRRFDHYFAQPRAFPVWPGLVFTVAFVITYETLAFGAYKVIRALGFNDDFKRVSNQSLEPTAPPRR